MDAAATGGPTGAATIGADANTGSIAAATDYLADVIRLQTTESLNSAATLDPLKTAKNVAAKGA